MIIQLAKMMIQPEMLLFDFPMSPHVRPLVGLIAITFQKLQFHAPVRAPFFLLRNTYKTEKLMEIQEQMFKCLLLPASLEVSGCDDDGGEQYKRGKQYRHKHQ